MMTRLFGVIGDPIDHSLSPAIHNAAFAALGIDAEYGRFHVPAPSLRKTLAGLVAAGCEGLNVTVPLKERIVDLVDEQDAQAQAIGAVNTVTVRRGRLLGSNTDGVGLARALADLGWKPTALSAVILGAGGAARAAAWELSRSSGARLVIANRRPLRAYRLARWLRRRRPRVRVEVLPLQALRLDRADILINATTVGMRPADASLVPPAMLRRGLMVYDLVYQRQTALVRQALQRGCVAAGGASMLLYQGAASFEAWFGVDAPVAVMRRALMEALNRNGRMRMDRKLSSAKRRW